MPTNPVPTITSFPIVLPNQVFPVFLPVDQITTVPTIITSIIPRPNTDFDLLGWESPKEKGTASMTTVKMKNGAMRKFFGANLIDRTGFVLQLLHSWHHQVSNTCTEHSLDYHLVRQMSISNLKNSTIMNLVCIRGIDRPLILNTKEAALNWQMLVQKHVDAQKTEINSDSNEYFIRPLRC